MDNIPEIVKEFAKKCHVCQKLEKLKKWHGYSIYQPITTKHEGDIGLPYAFMYKDGQVRWSTEEETLNFMNK